MLNYEIGVLLHEIIPYSVMLLSIVSGIVISNLFWKARIHRYARAEVIQMLEYNKLTADRLKVENTELKRKNTILKDQMTAVRSEVLKALAIVKDV